MFLIAYTSLQILNRTVLVLLGTLGGYILRFPQKQHEFYSNVPVKWVFWTMCLGDNLLDPALSGGLPLSTANYIRHVPTELKLTGHWWTTK